MFIFSLNHINATERYLDQSHNYKHFSFIFSPVICDVLSLSLPFLTHCKKQIYQLQNQVSICF